VISDFLRLNPRRPEAMLDSGLKTRHHTGDDPILSTATQVITLFSGSRFTITSSIGHRLLQYTLQNYTFFI